MSAIRDKFLARVYSGTSKEFDPEVIAETSERLKAAMFDGYGSTFSDIEVDSNDFEMLNNLERNVYQFSAAKNYQELQQLTQLLTDENGQLRSFTDFRVEAEKVFKTFNEDYLSTEYGTAVNSAMQASRWADYTKNAKAMPYLRYVTAGDSRVRDSHKSLDGVVKRIDDVFWNSFYPPNGYNCRCTTTQTGQSKETAESAITYPSVNPMFKTNLAKQGLVFPKNHPYYDGAPNGILRESLSYIPPENMYRTIKVDGEKIEEHAMVQHEDKLAINKNRTIASVLKKEGYKDVKLLPQIHYSDKDGRVAYYGKNYAAKEPNKCPDALVNGEIVEFKTASARNMSRRVFEASKKSNVCVLLPTVELTDKQVERFIKGQFNLDDRKNLAKIIIVRDGKAVTYNR